MAKVMSLQAIVQEYKKHLTNQQLAKVLGVTPHQVYLYATGKTKYPRDEIVDRIYDTLRYEGEPVVLDIFRDEEEYLKHRKIREEIC